MTALIAKLLDAAPRILFSIWVVGIAFLVLPEGLVGLLRLTEFLALAGAWIGPVTVAAFVLWAVHPDALRARLRALRLSHRHLDRILEELDALSGEEWLVLAYFAYRNGRSQALWSHYPPVLSLIQKGLLQRAARSGFYDAFPHTMPMDVWEVVKVRPEIAEALQREDSRNVLMRFPEYQRRAVLGL